MNNPTRNEDPLAQPILEMLRRFSPHWETFDGDALTALEQEALRLLTAAGFVERRLALRLGLLGHPVHIEAAVAAAGEYGLVEALGPIIDAGWRVWSEEYRKQAGSPPEDPPPRFHCEKAGAEMIRLTDQGQIALEDLRNGRIGPVLDFVLRRGLAFAVRPHVPGAGRTEKLRIRTACPAAPTDVRVTNLSDVSAPLVEVAKILHQKFEQRGSGSQGAGGRSPTAGACDPAAKSDEFVFRQEPGGLWRIRYEDREVGFFPNERGFRYIHELLIHGGTTVSATQLRARCAQMPVGRSPRTTAEAAAADLAAFFESDRAVDPEALRKIRQALDDLKARRAESSDPEAVVESGERIQQIEAYLKRSTDVRGKPRRLKGDRVKRDADSVRARIQLALDKIDLCDKACGRHLLQSITTGSALAYIPSASMVWSLS